jgi:hypothetical protein
MPRIIVEAHPTDRARSTMTLLESISPSQIECDHFSEQLVERLRWAIDDAARLESRVGVSVGSEPAHPPGLPRASRAA